MAVVERGEIRWFRFERPDKRRPVLIIGREGVVDSWSLIPVIPCSTQMRGLPWEVRLGPPDGVPSICVLKPEWVRAVDKAGLGPLITTLPNARWPEVEAALLQALGFRD